MCSTVPESSSFHLEWSNHLPNIQSVLESLYAHQSLVDVTIACNDGVLKAHKVILSACSPYFESVFREVPCKHPVLVLKGICVKEMQALLRFMYRGQVDVPETELSALVSTACEFKVKGFAVDAVKGIENRQTTCNEEEKVSNVETDTPSTSSQKLKDNRTQDHEQTAGKKEMPEDDLISQPARSAGDLKTNCKESRNGEKTEILPSKLKPSPVVAESEAEAKIKNNVNNNTTSSTSNSTGSVNNNCNNTDNGTTFRRETRYKGQKRVDVGIRPPGRPRSVDKRETYMSNPAPPPVKKTRLRSTTTSALSSVPETNLRKSSDTCADSSTLTALRHSSLADTNSTTLQSITNSDTELDERKMQEKGVEIVPLPPVQIKEEVDSHEEEEDDDETAAEFFCIPHLRESPDITEGSKETEFSFSGISNDHWNEQTSGKDSIIADGTLTSTEGEGNGDMACPFCFTTCARFSDLKRHMRQHTEDKPHECEFCSLAFARASHLARHRRTHTGERPFRCPAPSCERSFSRQDKLKLHTTRAHPGLSCNLMGPVLRLKGRKRLRDKNVPIGHQVGVRSPPVSNSSHNSSVTIQSPPVISLPFGDTSYLTSLSLGQQRYDLTISPVSATGNSVLPGSGPGGNGSLGNGGVSRNDGSSPNSQAAEELLKSVRQLGECTIQTLPGKLLTD